MNNNPKHLVWLQLESAGSLMQRGMLAKNAVLKLDYDFIEFKDLIAPAPSTVMSTMGMFTGIPSVYLSESHRSKNEKQNYIFKEKGIITLPTFLENNGYNVIGLHDMVNARKSLPDFRDNHLGVTDDMKTWRDPFWWGAEVLFTRFKNIKHLFKNKLNAIFMHLVNKISDFQKLPEIFSILNEIGMNKSNTVVIVVGDHGIPKEACRFNGYYQKSLKRLKLLNPSINVGEQFWHDVQLCEYNIRISAYMAYPGSEKTIVKTMFSGLDLAPTTLNLLGYDEKKVLKNITGQNIIPFLRKSDKDFKRTIRIDNRYISQDHDRVIALVNSKYKYIYRYPKNVDCSPIYKLTNIDYFYKEELYFRDDINEKRNLIFEADFEAIVKNFRDILIKEEKKLSEYYGKEKYNPKLIFEESAYSSPLYWNLNISEISLRMIKLEIKKRQLKNILIISNEYHFNEFIQFNIINQNLIAGVIIPGFCENSIREIKVFKSVDEANKLFDSILYYTPFEYAVHKSFEKLIPKEKIILQSKFDFARNILNYIKENVELNLKENERDNLFFSDFFKKILTPTNVLYIDMLENKIAEEFIYNIKVDSIFFIKKKSEFMLKKFNNKNELVDSNHIKKTFCYNDLEEKIRLYFGELFFEIIYISISKENIFDLGFILNELRKMIKPGSIIILSADNDLVDKFWKSFSSERKSEYMFCVINNLKIALYAPF